LYQTEHSQKKASRREIPDTYFPYAGVVVEKGLDSHLGVGGWGRYIIIQDEQGRRSKKYVG
jgi:hypothetical protein